MITRGYRRHLDRYQRDPLGFKHITESYRAREFLTARWKLTLYLPGFCVLRRYAKRGVMDVVRMTFNLLVKSWQDHCIVSKCELFE